MFQMVERGVAAESGNHLVQFYDAEPKLLVENVAAFIDQGLQAGESVVVIATPEHSDAFLSALGESRGQHDVRSRRLVFLDAQATLDQLLSDGRPDWQRFEQLIGGTVRGLRRAKPARGLRAYGEMVGILWAAGKVEAAVQLEQFWNRLLGRDDFTLFCGYPIDIYGDAFSATHVHDVLCAHTAVVPAGAGSAMESALERSMREVLDAQAAPAAQLAGRASHPSWGGMPGVEATILWLRQNQPKQAGEILARARTYYRANA